jgi:hypothetical protein
MRFVETKTPEQQSCLMLHRTRHLFIRQQTAVINASVPILPSLGSSLRSDAMVSRNCSMLSPIQRGLPKCRQARLNMQSGSLTVWWIACCKAVLI